MERLAWNSGMEQRHGTAGKGLRRDGDEARAKSAGRAREVRGGPYCWPYSRRPDWPGRAGGPYGQTYGQNYCQTYADPMAGGQSGPAQKKGRAKLHCGWSVCFFLAQSLANAAYGKFR